jgi:hypothetical protein
MGVRGGGLTQVSGLGWVGAPDSEGSPVTPRPRALAPAGYLALVAVLALLLMAAPAAATGPPQTGSGNGVITNLEITSERTAGPNSIQERTITMAVTGTLDGTFVQEVRGVVHDGRFVTFQGTGTFTGTMEGCGAGTVTLGITGKGSAGQHPVTESSVRVIGSASNTIDARGVGTVLQDGPLMSYEIRFIC